MQIDDDDPKTPVQPPAPADAPADDQDGGQAPEGDEPEGDDDAETRPPADDEDVGDGDDEQDDEGDGDDDGEQPKRKTSRAQRYKRQAERLKAENESLRSRTGGSLPQDQAALQRAFEYKVWQEIGDPPDPNDPRFKNADGSPNYARFEREAQGWENDRRQVSRQVRKDMLDGAAR